MTPFQAKVLRLLQRGWVISEGPTTIRLRGYRLREDTLLALQLAGVTQVGESWSGPVRYIHWGL